MEWLADPDAWLALLTLTALEIVLGIDKLVFVSIQSGRLPRDQQARARRTGLGLALVMRVLLLFGIKWIMGLTAPWFSVREHAVSGRDLILLAGGLFLMWKSVTEIHHKLEGAEANGGSPKAVTFGSVIAQIALLDLVFSLDSVITAVGMANELGVMVTAVVISMGVMLAFVGPLCAFVDRHPTVKMLALSFLLLIGFTLVAEGFHIAIPKGYIYFAMGFSVLVEFLNLKLRKAGKAVHLHGPVDPAATPPDPVA
jgi:predicted tellurium resistance membrane protein TerC